MLIRFDPVKLPRFIRITGIILLAGAFLIGIGIPNIKLVDFSSDNASAYSSGTQVQYPVLSAIAPSSMIYLGMNINLRPLNDARVRMAIYLALDRDVIAAELKGGKVISIVNPAFENPYVNQARDTIQASKLLAEAGYPMGFSIVLSTSIEMQSAARMVAGYLSAVNIKVTISPMSSSLEKMLITRSIGVGFFLTDTKLDWTNTPELLGRLLSSLGNENYTGYKNSQFDDLFKSTAYDKAELVAFDSNLAGVVIVPLYWLPNPGDIQPPATVTNLAVSRVTDNSVTLNWTAPGDDGSVGIATQYDIRYSERVPISIDNWTTARQVLGEPAPRSSGSSELFLVTGLTSGVVHYFALKTADEVPNWSGISNLARVSTVTTPIGDVQPPISVMNLVVTRVTDNSVTLNWTAPGDDGPVGTASQYDIRYQEMVPVSINNWGTARQVVGEPTPRPPGSNELFNVTGLASGVTYYFALRTADEVLNWSGISNSPQAITTSPSVAPKVSTYDASNITKNAVRLNGELWSLGSAEVAFVFFEGGTVSGEYTDSTDRIPMSKIGDFHSDISGLSAGTTYYFRAVASGAQTVYGEEISFQSGRANPATAAIIVAAVIVVGVGAGLLVNRAYRLKRSRQKVLEKTAKTRAKPPSPKAKMAEKPRMAEAESPPSRAEERFEASHPELVAPELKRYVNVWFSRSQMESQRIEKNLTLVKNKNVFLHLQIAGYKGGSLLEKIIAFPDQDEIEEKFPEIKGRPIPLDVTLFSRDFRITKTFQKLELMRGKPTDAIYFEVTPEKLGMSYLRAIIFYRNHLLQSLIVSAFVTEKETPTGELQRASVDMAFNANFTKVEELPARGLWLGINQSSTGTHTLYVADSGKVLSRDLSDMFEKALTKARKALQEVTFDVINGEKVYRFNIDNTPKGDDSLARFKADLTKLAIAGRSLYDAVLGTGQLPAAEERTSVQPIVDEIRRLLRNEQIIQIVRLRFKDIWPWAIMYDSVIDSKNVKDVCMAFKGENGHPLTYTEGVKKCHHRDPATGRNIDKTIICPYDFWGFKHIIEQPVQHGKREAVYADLPREIKTGYSPILLMPVEKNLMNEIKSHRKNMEALNFKALDSYSDIWKAFTPPPEPHVMYFFCHGEYNEVNDPYLMVGNGEKLMPAELDDQDFRWENAHTLVFINGCHTVEMEPEDLSTIMKPFVEAGASGIIGTEVGVVGSLATGFAEKFFDRLLKSRQPVGEIVRDLRLELLMQYNPLGLVYTPYCSADLRVVQ